MKQMKRLFAISVLACLAGLECFAQLSNAPTALVVPSDTWMKANGYVKKVVITNDSVEVCDYGEALTSHRELSTVLASVHGSLKDNGFGYISTNDVVKHLENDGTIESLMNEKRPDFRIEVDFDVRSMGPRKNVSVKINVSDAYCHETVATLQNASMAIGSVEQELQKLISSKAGDLADQMKAYCQYLREHGRQVTVQFRPAEDTDIDFFGVFDKASGTTYGDYLFSWLSKQSIGGAIKKGRITKRICEFRNVRVPFFNDKGNVLDPDVWGNTIMKSLRSESGMKVSRDDDYALGSIRILVGKDE